MWTRPKKTEHTDDNFSMLHIWTLPVVEEVLNTRYKQYTGTKKETCSEYLYLDNQE